MKKRLIIFSLLLLLIGYGSLRLGILLDVGWLVVFGVLLIGFPIFAVSILVISYVAWAALGPNSLREKELQDRIRYLRGWRR